jgi:asparagine synthase (glutamine-hydrolysing)
MCGIFSIFSKDGDFQKEIVEQIIKNFDKLGARGPDASSLTITDNGILGFKRLAINDTSAKGMQPFEYKSTYTMCNGEIYNYEELRKPYEELLKSHSDCEILPHLIHQNGFENTIKMLDGVFAIAHYDRTRKVLEVGRDRLGVKPVFFGYNDYYFAVASEAKALDGLFFDNVCQLQPGSILSVNTIELKHLINSSILSLPEPTSQSLAMSYEDCVKTIHDLLVKSVKKRMTSDREIGCLLSGGLDSSVVAAILSKEMKANGKLLRTFSIGFPDSTDIIYAREVAEYIGSDHQEYIIQYEDALPRLKDVIKAIETYDTTTVRASTPMFLLCEWISKNFPDKVIFSGEGSDELFCGYLYFHNAPSSEDAHNDSCRLLNELYMYDVLRADRCTASNGLEFREPFLDKELIDFVVKMNPNFNIPRIKNDNGVMFEKTILRQAFESYLPSSVAWRRKAAFSDAVSSSEKPWYKWIHEYVETQNFVKVEDSTDESSYYKTLLKTFYDNYWPVQPLWLPRWSNVGKEPSATVLNVYNKSEH